MERLWSPWRGEYIASGGADLKADRCIFCEIYAEPASDEKNFVVYRGTKCYALLNLYPYISGHLLIVPNEHLGELETSPKEITDELMDLTKRSQTALRRVYSPDGFNVGMNLGRAAGAGILGHIHIHILPRWGGDTNFMTAVGETRVLPEDLHTTWQKLSSEFDRS